MNPASWCRHININQLKMMLLSFLRHCRHGNYNSSFIVPNTTVEYCCVDSRCKMSLDAYRVLENKTTT